MKMMKRLLAAALAAVLALTVLAGCGTLAANNIAPESVRRAYEVMNNQAQQKTGKTLTYNTNFDGITKAVWLNYVDNYVSAKNTAAFEKRMEEIEADLKKINAKAEIVIGVIVDEDGTVRNPVVNTATVIGTESWNFDPLFSYTDPDDSQNAWGKSTYVSMYNVSDDGYLMVCTYRIG